MPTVNVGYSSSKKTLTFDPDPVVAEKFSKPTITWVPNSPVADITGIDIQSDWIHGPGNPRQPARKGGGSKDWTVFNPNGSVKTYKYAVTATLDDGSSITVDPEIDNRGQGP